MTFNTDNEKSRPKKDLEILGSIIIVVLLLLGVSWASVAFSGDSKPYGGDYDDNCSYRVGLGGC